MKILVALDRSEQADRALAPVMGLAQSCGMADVILLNVFSPWVDMGHVQASSRAEAEAQVTAERQQYLAARAAMLPGLPVRTIVEPRQRAEEVDQCIARVAREQAVDLVVVMSRRVTHPIQRILGGFAEGVVRLSPCPVVVVRPDHDLPPSARPTEGGVAEAAPDTSG